MNKKIIMCTGEEKAFDDEFTMFKSNKYNIKHCKMFKKNGIFHKIARNIGWFFPYLEINKDLADNIKNTDIIIIFDSVVKNSFIKVIRKLNPSIRIIIYFRNKFSNTKQRNIDINKLSKLNIEFWTYNLDDVKKYNFKYNNQFWNLNFLQKNSIDCDLKYDMVFLGRNKNRINFLEKLNLISKKYNLKKYFYLVPYSFYEFDENINNKYLKYDEYLTLINSSKAIIDLVNDDNYGLTLRPLEAVFLEKKIITNYSEIKKYDFYNKSNIFIIGEDNEDKLIDFINGEFKKISKEIMYKYTYDGWLDNFNIEGDTNGN